MFLYVLRAFKFSILSVDKNKNTLGINKVLHF